MAPTSRGTAGKVRLRVRSSASRLLLLLVPSILGMGCDSCRRSRRPYTPFTVDASDALVSPASSASVPPAANVSATVPLQAVPPAAPTEARKLDPPTGRFSLGPRVIELPKDLLADRLLEKPAANQPGQLDALVWVIPAKSSAEWDGPMGELWQFLASTDPKKLWALPAWMPSGADCLHDVRLAQLGKATYLVDVRAKCERSVPQRSPNRSLALLAPDSPQPFLLGLRIADPAPDETLSVTAVLTDRDGDGREDPSVRFGIEVASTKTHAEAGFGWLDRAAGTSVDESFFLASLEALLSGWETALGKKPQIPTVMAELGALRRLLGSLCQQSATARIFDWRGEAMRCPSVSQLATRLARIEVRGALTLGDPIEAAHALSMASSWFGGIPSQERDDLRRKIIKSLTKISVSGTAPIAVRPAQSSDPIHYSPLRFDDDGMSLLVQTERGEVERINLDGTLQSNEPAPLASAGSDEAAGSTAVPPAKPAAKPWSLWVAAPDGRRWLSVAPACDRSEMSMVLKAGDGRLLPLQPIHLLAPRPGVCRSPAPWPVAVAPIDWQGDTPMALIDGSCWSGSAGQPCPSPEKMGRVVPGSPRSPDGRRLIVATSVGPVVLGGQKPELFSGAEIDGKALRDCVVNNGARAIACIADSAVLLVTRVEPGNKR